MKPRTFILTLLPMLSLAFAGCSDGGGGGGGGETTTLPPIEAGKGAITGLLIDDAFRPLPGGLVLLGPVGLTTTSDAEGVFSFTDLDPGSYVARADVADHEAAPQPIEVREGEYAELNLVARRISSESGRIITNEYSIFMTCTAEVVIVAGNGLNCFFDFSGESERTGFNSNITDIAADVTYMVTEAKFNQVGDYGFVIAIDDDGDQILDRYWAEAEVLDTDYVRTVNLNGEVNNETNAGRNIPWEPAIDNFFTTVFPHGEFYTEINENTDLICVDGCSGVGVDAGIRGKIIQSIFIGEPTVDINTYAVLA
ncbi:MAG TPA: carboxypeptidase-like regulatory domain-containing protein [Candidatus Thermoplasmatota archaeon]|nr:carboxypeptidase-like regulatory domain-containing protein [Candidatus Thermoplasmatota archaeon]